MIVVDEEKKNLHGPRYLSKNLGKMRKEKRGEGHDLVRRVDKQGGTENWVKRSREWNPIDENVASPSKWALKNVGKMLKNVQIFEIGNVPAKEAEN